MEYMALNRAQSVRFGKEIRSGRTGTKLRNTMAVVGSGGLQFEYKDQQFGRQEKAGRRDLINDAERA